MTDSTPEFLPPPFLYKKGTFVISEDNPWENDCLGRKEQADKLDKILDAVSQPIVMTLSAPYGMGKSTFLRCWKQSLQKRGVTSVLFNAWETDFSHDAFAAFVASIQSQLKPKSESKKNFVKAATKIGGAIVKNAPAFAAKVVAKAAIGERGIEALENFELDEDDAVKLAEGIATDSFKSQIATQNAVKEFQESFEKIITEELGGRILIFIDELDRCRPNYSVEVLERIKHIFAVKGAVFVLAVDKEQLLGSISGVYGKQIDADRYLRKFIDWEYELPAPNHYRYISHLYYNVFEFDKQNMLVSGENIENGDVTFFTILTLFAKNFDVSLRDLGQYFTYLNLVWQSKVRNYYPMEIALAAFFKCLLSDKCESYINWTSEKQFYASPIQNNLRKMITTDSQWLEEKYSKDLIVGWIILLFSKPSAHEKNKRLCVDGDFLNKYFPTENAYNSSWLLSRLDTHRFGKRFPNIQAGLLVLKEMNL